MPLPKVDTRTDEQRARHNAKMKRYFANHPEQRQRKAEQVKARYHSDPEYRERVRVRAREAALKRHATAETTDVSGSSEVIDSPLEISDAAEP